MPVDQWVKIAEITTPIVAVIALLITIWQIRSDQKAQWKAIDLERQSQREAQQSQREATAKELYNGYLKLALENPECSTSDYWSDHRLPMVVGVYLDPSITEKEGEQEKERSRHIQRYEWFVSYMLYTFEEILRTFPGNLEWINIIEGQLEYHKEYLRHLQSTSRINHYNGALQQLIIDVIGISGKKMARIFFDSLEQ